jgi:hypothetical protein
MDARRGAGFFKGPHNATYTYLDKDNALAE